MIDFLCAVQPLIKVCFTLCMSPEHIPVVSISTHETIQLQYESYEFGFTLQHLIKAKRCLIRSLMIRPLSWKICLLIAYALDFFDQGFIDLYLTSIFWLHHFKYFEFNEIFVWDRMTLIMFGIRIFSISFLRYVRSKVFDKTLIH